MTAFKKCICPTNDTYLHCPKCGASPKKKAERARFGAAGTYRRDAGHYLQRGILWHDKDPDAAVALWLDGMSALDAANTVENGMRREAW